MINQHSPDSATSLSEKKVIAIIGAGPAGLFAAECLARKGYSVHLFDHMKRAGLKFLLAGRTGLNLTHSEPFEILLSRYGKAQSWLEPALRAFTPTQLIEWAEGLDQPCFTGSSGRVFLKSFKASPLLRAWLERLRDLGVTFHARHKLVSLETQKAQFQTATGLVNYKFDGCVLALGGASWSRLGSDGQWVQMFPHNCAPLEPSNCGFYPDWSEEFCQTHEGAILKAITLTYDKHQIRGDLTLTRRGLEGGPLYTLSPHLRDAIKQNGEVIVKLNFRPLLSHEVIVQRLSQQRPRESRANRLRKALKFDRFSTALINHYGDKTQDNESLASMITSFPLKLVAPAALDRAISTAGGIKSEAFDEHFMLKSQAGIFVCGEMLDWEAPTGGYLLQACFSTAFACSHHLDRWLSQ
ncbi:TIGR03862 family flavoprotein [Aristophania vespae]|uniref:TIGR03862 family flavoprotein n=1 Tax=Aristophania vespae TaxID=2697033 RepID=UPI00235109D9|nr:TIGR03862 family flavoprotein [Aristophania vespae]UMM64513.1 3-dehydro-bile acid delta(4,6)-reductase [Aristophania vespae]